MRDAAFFRIVLGAAVLMLTCLPAWSAADNGLEYFRFESQQQELQMAYVDVRPVQANGRTVLLLHGKNFCSAYWQGTTATLIRAGFRVIAPEQIGFCGSSLPRSYQYSFQQLATNTIGLLDSLGVDQVSVVGHSMGGMLATRFALMYPHRVQQLVLLNPIGLEDWQALGVPYRSVDAWYAAQQQVSYEGIRRYQVASYYDGAWTPQYERWARDLADLYTGPRGDDIAWSQALTYDMVFTQPVVYEFPRLQMPTTLLIGLRDRTAVGKDSVSPALREKLGDYPTLAQAALAAIPQSRLITFAGIGHLPHIEAPERFYPALLDALGAAAP